MSASQLPDSRRHLLRGSAWMMSLRWSLRLAGVVSTMLLARLLSPADFGVVAMAFLFVGLMEAVGETGERLALLREADPSREHYDTAWTIQLMVGITLTAAIFLLAPLAAHWFHDPRAVPVMRLLAFRGVLSGLENIGTVDFRRDLRFEALYRLSMGAKLLAMLVTLALALAWRNYWALAVGIIAGQCAITLLSYVMHPYRPRLSLARRREIAGFSAWTLLRSIGLYLTAQLDMLAVGNMGSSGAMGRYAVAADVASSPVAEINEPMVAVLYPVMSKVRQDKAALRTLYLHAVGCSAVICAAAGAGIALIAADYARLMLGPQWGDTIPLIPWLALAAAFSGLSSGVDTSFDALGLPHRSARLQWLRLALFVAALLPVALLTRNIELIAATRFAVAVLFLPLLLASIGGAIEIGWRDYLAVLWRPVAAACAMAAVLSASAPLLPAHYIPRLLLEIPLGAAWFGAVLLLLWELSGRPASPEQDAITLLRKLRQGILKRGVFAFYTSARPKARK